jgi:hypothetical protein
MKAIRLMLVTAALGGALVSGSAEAASNKKFNFFFDITNVFLRSSYFVGGLDIGLGKLSIGPVGGIVSGGYVLGGSVKFNFKGIGESSFYLDGQYNMWKTSISASWLNLFAGYRWYIQKSPVFTSLGLGARYFLSDITYLGVSLGTRGAIVLDYYMTIGVSF